VNMFERSFYKTVECADGFTMSVQASRRNYSTPRNDTGPYDSVEVGYPSRECSILLPYAEKPEDPTDSVYGYVPADTIIECIDAHGGITDGELPPLDLVTAYYTSADKNKKDSEEQ